MRILLTASLGLLMQFSVAADVFTVNVSAPKEAGKALLLYGYDELFTMRTIRVAETMLDSSGNGVLSGQVEGTARMQLRIGDAIADLYLRPGSVLHVEWPGPDPRVPRSLNRPARVPIVFHDMDALDINALTSDLNERLDEFLMNDLATDEVAGMQAWNVQRVEGVLPDTTERPPTLFVTPALSAARVDSFELKLRKFYRGIDDPWFDQYLDYGVAGLRHGPRANDRELYERYLKGRPVLYDDPEFVRFIRGLFEEQLLTFAFRYHQQALARALALGDLDSLKHVMARHDFLRDDDRLCELVAMDQLYLHFGHKQIDPRGTLRILEQAARGSSYPEHRTIAANMVWDLTAMSAGSPLPKILLQDLNGRDVAMDTLTDGPICLVFTATWCTYCELEMAGLEQLHKQYKDLIPIVVVSLDQDPASVKKYLKQYPGRDFRWLHAVAEQQLREDLRVRSLPSVLLIQDGVLMSSPAPLPSAGLGEIFYRTSKAMEQDGRIKVWDD